MKQFTLLLFLLFPFFSWAQSCEFGNCKTGTGFFINEEGDTYEGRFREEYRHGKGKFTWTNGTVYDGNWKFDKRHGIGKLTYIDGSYYEGQWVYDFKEGLGTEVDSDGNKYEGHYLAGHKEGYGKYFWSNGSYYEGNWDDDQINGIGAKYYPDKSHYEGEFRDGECYGYGVLYDANNQVLNIGLWVSDDFSESKDEAEVYRVLFEKQKTINVNEFSVSDIYDNNSPAVFTILAKDTTGTRVKGAGIILSLDGVALCPLNLITPDTAQVFVLESNTFELDTLIYSNPVLNFAIIKLKVDTLSHCVQVSQTPPTKNDPIYILGPTIAFQNTIHAGSIETVTTESFLFVNDEADKKLNNGSGVFNAAGELIGMTLLSPAISDKKMVLNLNTIKIPGFPLPIQEE